MKSNTKLTEEILSKWQSLMTQESMRLNSTASGYTDYVQKLQQNHKIIKLMAQELVDLLKETIKKEIQPELSSSGTTIWQGKKFYVTQNTLTDKEKQRVRTMMESEGKEENTFINNPIPLPETWVNIPEFESNISEESADLTSYVFTPGPRDKHLHGYFCGQVNGQWETTILGETFWARYHRKLTYEEVKQVIINQKETEAMNFNDNKM